MINVDLLITNIRRLVTCAAPDGPLRGAPFGSASSLEEAALAIAGGRLVAVGASAELSGQYRAAQSLDGAGLVAIPGFVDPHTHCCYAGDRADEFALRIAGATYQELMAAGGGIMASVRATRAASVAELVAQTRPRLDRMLAHGTTTVEIKTGYGLTTEHELAMLEAIAQLERSHPLSIVPTFIGAHAIPAEYRGNAAGYTQLVIDEMLPAVARWWAGQDVWREALACDVFCEEGAFDLAQSRLILARARELGFATKLHVDEFAPLGGTPLAVELGALSADHLVATPPDHIALLAQSPTVAVALPGTPFGLGHHEFTPARAIVAAGGALALATDCNPGTSICESMPFIIALACRYLRLTPTEALHAATINAAYALGRAAEVGSLAVGKRADVALLALPSEQHLGYRFGTNPVALVVKDGKVVVDRRRG
ncbi:MAG: imidazolonepropionase [Herpetosiphonaceae bacterium]|nr:imidazolonepropionase [Herpetosiphonaceae bacterium]